MPLARPWVHVVKDKLHGADFEIIDPYVACVQSAKIIAWSLVDLLSNKAEKALEIEKQNKPPLTKGSLKIFVGDF